MRAVLKQGGAALDAVHLVSLGEQKLGEVGPVLPGDSGDQRFLQTSISFASSARQLGRAFRSACVAGLALDETDGRERIVPMPQPLLDYGTRRARSYTAICGATSVLRKKRLPEAPWTFNIASLNTRCQRWPDRRHVLYCSQHLSVSSPDVSGA